MASAETNERRALEIQQRELDREQRTLREQQTMLQQQRQHDLHQQHVQQQQQALTVSRLESDKRHLTDLLKQAETDMDRITVIAIL